MKILDRYIARQLLGVTALGVMALSALLLLGNLFKELRPLLVETRLPSASFWNSSSRSSPFR